MAASLDGGEVSVRKGRMVKCDIASAKRGKKLDGLQAARKSAAEDQKDEDSPISWRLN